MSLPYAVLGILTYSPMTGYNLGKIFNESINYAWTASLSQIYRELDALAKKGYVTSSIEQQDDRPDKKIYSITEEGNAAFLQWLTDFPESFSTPKRDEFTLRLFFGSKVGNEEAINQLKRYIEMRENFKNSMAEGKKIVYKIIGSLKTGKTEASINENELFWYLIAKRAMMINETSIKWAQECIRELENNTGREVKWDRI